MNRRQNNSYNSELWRAIKIWALVNIIWSVLCFLLVANSSTVGAGLGVVFLWIITVPISIVALVVICFMTRNRERVVYGVDGYMYYAQATNEMIGIGRGSKPITNLVRRKPDHDEAILYMGNNLPKYRYAYCMGYRNIQVANNYVVFTAVIWGSKSEDGWRSSLLYTADFQVDKDGSNISLRHEEFF